MSLDIRGAIEKAKWVRRDIFSFLEETGYPLTAANKSHLSGLIKTHDMALAEHLLEIKNKYAELNKRLDEAIKNGENKPEFEQQLIALKSVKKWLNHSI